MVDINPFFDSDTRNGLQFLSGVNLIFIGISLVVDSFGLIELAVFSDTWAPTSFYFPVYVGYALLGCDIFANLLQLLCGWRLYTSITRNKAYRKLNWVFWPFVLLYIIELSIIISYLVCIPSSPYFYYATSLTFLYKGFLLWPLKKFINDHSHDQPRYQANERTRLLASVA